MGRNYFEFNGEKFAPNWYDTILAAKYATFSSKSVHYLADGTEQVIHDYTSDKKLVFTIQSSQWRGEVVMPSGKVLDKTSTFCDGPDSVRSALKYLQDEYDGIAGLTFKIYQQTSVSDYVVEYDPRYNRYSDGTIHPKLEKDSKYVSSYPTSEEEKVIEEF